MSLKPQERFYVSLAFAILFLIGTPLAWALRKNTADQRVCTVMYLVAGGAHNTGTTTVLYTHNNSTATTTFGTNATNYSNGLWCVNLDATATNSEYVGVVFHPNSSIALDALVQMYTEVDANIMHINSTATTSGRVDANVTHVSGTLQTGGDLFAHLNSTLYGLNALHNDGTLTHRATIILNTTIASADRSTTTLRLVGGSDQTNAYRGMNVILDGDEGGGMWVSRSISASTDTGLVTFEPSIPHNPVDGGKVYIVPSNPLINDIDIEADALVTNLALVPKSNGTLSFNSTAVSGIQTTILGHLNGTLDAGTHLNSTAQAAEINTVLSGAHGNGSWDATGTTDLSSVLGHLNGTLGAGMHVNSTAQVEAIDTQLSGTHGPGVWSK